MHYLILYFGAFSLFFIFLIDQIFVILLLLLNSFGNYTIDFYSFW